MVLFCVPPFFATEKKVTDLPNSSFYRNVSVEEDKNEMTSVECG